MGGLGQLPVWIIIFMVSGSLHEFGHAYAAYRLGDTTAEEAGRLTVNPIAHVDPLGLLMLILSSIAGFGFGWMKPVPVSPWRLAQPRRDLMIISAAGPASNLLQAIVLFMVARLLHADPLSPALGMPGAQSPLVSFFGIAVVLNVCLALFNLIPVRPLDGFAVLNGLLPHDTSIGFEQVMGRYGPLLFIGVLVMLHNVNIWPFMFWVLDKVHWFATIIPA